MDFPLALRPERLSLPNGYLPNPPPPRKKTSKNNSYQCRGVFLGSVCKALPSGLKSPFEEYGKNDLGGSPRNWSVPRRFANWAIPRRFA